LITFESKWPQVCSLARQGGFSFSPLVFQFARRKTLIKIVDTWPLINYYRFIISVRINVIFIHSETSRIARTRMTHLFKESETRQCEGNERKQGNVVIDESGDIQCIFFLLTRRLKVTNKLNISRYTNIDKFVHIRYIFLIARRAYSWLFQLAQMWKLLAPGVGLVDFLTPDVCVSM
jgi:hypothetical protein